MKEVVAAFNQEKALVGAFSVITNLRIAFVSSSTSEPELAAVPGAGAGAGAGEEGPEESWITSSLQSRVMALGSLAVEQHYSGRCISKFR